MKVTVNGRELRLRDALTAAELLAELELRREVVVIERNEEIIPRADVDRVRLEDGDRIEIIRMIAGG